MKNNRMLEIFDQRYNQLVVKTDRLFAYLFVFQWILGIIFALTVSPRTWSGAYNQIHIHVFAAVCLGGLIAAFPIFLIWRNPGESLNRIVVAMSQILFSVLFIHLTGGRIETHFHVFGSLAFLAFYRDWRPVAVATLITATDHLVRGFFWPESVYGVLSATPWRAFEHAAWVIFEDVILFYSIKLALGELKEVSESQAKMEELNFTLEERVKQRTEEIELKNKEISRQQGILVSSSKMSALGEMAGGIAHEINSPLAAIKNISGQIQDVLTDIPVDTQLAKEMSQKIESTANRISKIVQGLRTFSRDGSRDPYDISNISQIIDDTLSFCSERIKNRGIDLKIECRKDLNLPCRATEIGQVLLNLLSNAKDAIENLDERWIKIVVNENSNDIEIAVLDSGKGIEHQVQSKIFQPFFTTKELGKGTGLGLGISLGIIQNHEGELFLDKNCPNTKFVIRLPKIREYSNQMSAA